MQALKRITISILLVCSVLIGIGMLHSVATDSSLALGGFASIYRPSTAGSFSIGPTPLGVPVQVTGFTANGPSLSDIPNFATSSIQVCPGPVGGEVYDYNVQCTISYDICTPLMIPPTCWNGGVQFVIYVNGVAVPSLWHSDYVCPLILGLFNNADEVTLTGLVSLTESDIVTVWAIWVGPPWGWMGVPEIRIHNAHLSILRLNP